MNEIFFQGFWRMDWGLGNPNKTAALLAVLMVAVWALAYIRKGMFWVSLVLFSVLSVCLVHTFSRGGMVAAFFGMIPLVVFSRRPWPKKRISGVVASVLLIIGASIYLQAHERYGQGVVQEDHSISNRFVLWKAAPAMMVDAPGGWGLGQSGKAYTDWYQPLDQSESYRTLVNSHLTWLVEFGWIGRFFYILGWMAVFLLCLPTTETRVSPHNKCPTLDIYCKETRWLAVPLGIWIAFFTGSFFSSVAESLWLWVVPALALAGTVVWRVRNHAWPDAKLLVLPPATAAAILLCIAGFTARSPVTKHGNTIVIGKGEPGTWVVADRKVLGNSFPRPLRSALATHPNLSCGLVEEFDDLPNAGIASLIVSGGAGTSGEIEKKLKSVKSLTLVNPAFSPAEFPVPKETNLRVVIGEFSPRITSEWAGVTGAESLGGVGDFVPNWPEVLLSHQP